MPLWNSEDEGPIIFPEPSGSEVNRFLKHVLVVLFIIGLLSFVWDQYASKKRATREPRKFPSSSRQEASKKLTHF